MTTLRQKLVELKSIRKSLQDQISRHDADTNMLETELKRLTLDLERRQKIYSENTEKLHKLDTVLEVSEKALERLSNTATRLDEVLGGELTAIKSQATAPTKVSS